MSDWDEQEGYWNRHLDRLAKEVKIDSAKIWDARKQLVVIFGDSWLREAYIVSSRGKHSDEKGVVGLVTNPIVNHAVEIVELYEAKLDSLSGGTIIEHSISLRIQKTSKQYD